MSRTCGGEVHFDDVEKEALRRLLWKMSEFCGVKVVTYCVMSNHFHVLVEVPWREVWLRRFEGPEGEKKLLEHLRTLYSKTFVGLLKDELDDLCRRGMTALAEEKVEAIKKRFCDLSVYVKEVKERFSRWFNKRRGRKGTLWMDRFKSVLVEGKGEPLHTMAAYIDLNPVRAGLVKDPKDYRWCGYAEALSGSRRAQRAMSKVAAKPVDGWESSGGAEAYRKLVYSQAVEVRSADKSEVVRRGVSAEESKAVLEAKRKLTAAELVRLRVRYFSDRLVIGGKEFVENILGQHREKFGPKRKGGDEGLRKARAACLRGEDYERVLLANYPSFPQSPRCQERQDFRAFCSQEEDSEGGARNRLVFFREIEKHGPVMNYKIFFVVAALAAVPVLDLQGADAPKKAPAKKTEAKADQDTYPFYGKVTAITSRTLTIVRGASAEAAETKFNLNGSTEYVNGDKPSSIEAVKVGAWVGGVVKKAAEGNDTVLKLNVGVKQKAAEKGKAKEPAKKKEEPKKKADSKKKAE